MRTATVTVRGVAPYSQSRPIQDEKLPKENAKDYEDRCWRSRIHRDEQGQVFMPPTAWKNGLSESAKYLSASGDDMMKISGKSTYTKNIESGVLVLDPVFLGIAADDVPGEWLFVPSDGRRGGSKRVWKCFPLISKWDAVVDFCVFDDAIPNRVFEYVVDQMGKFIGLGRFRPRNNGFYGRFTVEEIAWS